MSISTINNFIYDIIKSYKKENLYKICKKYKIDVRKNWPKNNIVQNICDNLETDEMISLKSKMLYNLKNIKKNKIIEHLNTFDLSFYKNKIKSISRLLDSIDDISIIQDIDEDLYNISIDILNINKYLDEYLKIDNKKVIESTVSDIIFDMKKFKINKNENENKNKKNIKDIKNRLKLIKYNELIKIRNILGLKSGGKCKKNEIIERISNEIEKYGKSIFKNCKYSDLQTIGKLFKIKANQKKEYLIDNIYNNFIIDNGNNDKKGYIYLICSESMKKRVKIGMTKIRNTPEESYKYLKKRYGTYYGKNIEIYLFKSDNRYEDEKSVHAFLNEKNVQYLDSELFEISKFEAIPYIRQKLTGTQLINLNKFY